MKRFSRFIIVGVAAFILDTGSLLIMESLTGNVLFSATVSFSPATLFNFGQLSLGQSSTEIVDYRKGDFGLLFCYNQLVPVTKFSAVVARRATKFCGKR